MSASLTQQVEEPETYAGAIPQDSTLPLSIVPLRGQITLRVRAGAGPEPVYGTGAVVSNFRNGYNDTSIFVKSSSVPTAGIPVAFGGTGVSVLANQPFVSHARMPISPALEQSASIGTLMAARISYKSNTVGTTAASLSGESAAAAIADFRDLRTWTQNEICSLAVTATSSFLGKSISRESHMWLGPDVMSEPTPVNSDLVRQCGADAFLSFLTNTGTVWRQVCINIFADGDSAGNRALFNLPKIPLTAKLRFRCRYADPVGGPLAVHFKKIWVRGNADPASPLDVVTEEEYHGAEAPATFSIWSHYVEFDNAGYRAAGYVPGAIIMTTNTAATSIDQVDAQILDLYGKQHYGGWRVGLWEDAAVGMNIAVSFVGAALATLVGNVAEYKKATVTDAVPDEVWTEFKRRFTTNTYCRVNHGEPYITRTTHTSFAPYEYLQDPGEDSPFVQLNRRGQRGRGVQMGMASDVLGVGASLLGNFLDKKLHFAGMAGSSTAALAAQNGLQ